MLGQRLIIIDHGLEHPLRAFNDTSGFQKANVGDFFFKGKKSMRMNCRKDSVMTQKSK